MEIILTYLAVSAGVFLEGEAVLIASSFAAYKGFFDIYTIFTIGFFTTLATDWFYYFLGKIQGRKLLDKNPRFQNKAEKITGWLDKNPLLVLFTYRFIYGFRLLLPMTIGISKIKTSTFLSISAISTFFWTVLVCVGGFFFGGFIDEQMGSYGYLKPYFACAVILTILGIVVWTARSGRSSEAGS